MEEAKIAAFHNVWIAKHIKKELSPELSAVIHNWSNKYQVTANININLWNSGNSHKKNIIKNTKSHFKYFQHLG